MCNPSATRATEPKRIPPTTSRAIIAPRSQITAPRLALRTRMSLTEEHVTVRFLKECGLLLNHGSYLTVDRYERPPGADLPPLPAAKELWDPGDACGRVPPRPRQALFDTQSTAANGQLHPRHCPSGCGRSAYPGNGATVCQSFPARSRSNHIVQSQQRPLARSCGGHSRSDSK